MYAFSIRVYGAIFLRNEQKSHFYYGCIGKRGVWSCVSQTHFLYNQMYKIAGVDLEHNLRRIFICSMRANRVFGNVDLGIEKEDTYLHSQKNQDIYGTEELIYKVILR